MRKAQPLIPPGSGLFAPVLTEGAAPLDGLKHVEQASATLPAVAHAGYALVSCRRLALSGAAPLATGRDDRPMGPCDAATVGRTHLERPTLAIRGTRNRRGERELDVVV